MRRRRLPPSAPLLALGAALAIACGHASPERGRGRPAEPPPGASAAKPTAPVLAWPVTGRLLSGFGERRATHVHRGLDLRVPSGTPVRAAAAGRVVFSGRMRGYGRVVILDHGGGLETLYAHHRANLVTVGERVERGQRIAESGASGNATTPHLHFEVREHRRARDPLGYLPRALPAAPAR